MTAEQVCSQVDRQGVPKPVFGDPDACAVGNRLREGKELACGRTLDEPNIVGGAKGHEWRATWVVGVEEGLMPHYRAVEAAEASGDTSTLDEELRGLYVAVTRARERLCLSASLQHARVDRLEPRLPSRWLHALGLDLIAAA